MSPKTKIIQTSRGFARRKISMKFGTKAQASRTGRTKNMNNVPTNQEFSQAQPLEYLRGRVKTPTPIPPTTHAKIPRIGCIAFQPFPQDSSQEYWLIFCTTRLLRN